MPLNNTPWKTSRDGLTVLSESRGIVIADCRNSAASLDERQAHATAIAALPRMVAALTVAEHVIGDMPGRQRSAQLAYDLIVQALHEAGHEIGGGDE